MRFGPVLLVLFASSVLAQDLEQPPKSSRARRLREEGDKYWAEISKVAEDARAGRKVEAADARRLMPLIEKAAVAYEKSLRLEWHSDANRTLAQAVRAWFKLRELHPVKEELPEKEARKVKRERTRAIRRFVMDYGKARRHTSQLNRCNKCEGRKEMRSPFGGKPVPCSLCNKVGVLIDREGVIEAHWLRHGPLYREQSRNTRDVARALKKGPRDPSKLGPFVRSVAIQSIEDNDVWARVYTKEKHYAKPTSKKNTRVEHIYTLYRVGNLWWLYDPRADRDLVDIPVIEEKKE